MTSINKNHAATGHLLEEILETVQSVDRNVEEILDHLRDHVENNRYRRNWDENGYHGDPELE